MLFKENNTELPPVPFHPHSLLHTDIFLKINRCYAEIKRLKMILSDEKNNKKKQKKQQPVITIVIFVIWDQSVADKISEPSSRLSPLLSTRAPLITAALQHISPISC